MKNAKEEMQMAANNSLEQSYSTASILLEHNFSYYYDLYYEDSQLISWLGKKDIDYNEYVDVIHYLEQIAGRDILTDSVYLYNADIETLYRYSENFFEAAHIITEFILYAEHPGIGKLDTYFFSIAFLYRHCLEVGLKAIGFQYIDDAVERKNFVKVTRHNLSEIFDVIVNKSDSIRPDEELEWLKAYLETANYYLV